MDTMPCQMEKGNNSQNFEHNVKPLRKQKSNRLGQSLELCVHGLQHQIPRIDRILPIQNILRDQMDTPLESDLAIIDSNDWFNDYVKNLQSNLLEIKQVTRQYQSRSKAKKKRNSMTERLKIREYKVGQQVYLYSPQIKRTSEKTIETLERSIHHSKDLIK